MWKRRKKILRVVRLVLLLAAGVLVAFFMRRHPRFTIPENDASLEPSFSGGTTLIVRRVDEDDEIARGDNIVYEMEQDGTRYARFGRVQALPGDIVDARDGHIIVNGEPIEPLPMPGAAAGPVPPKHVYVLATNPVERNYKDSRELGFIARDKVRAVILSSVK